MVVAVIILSVLVVFLSYLLYINYNRANRATDYCEAYVRFVSALYYRFSETKEKLKEVDHRGSFQADDEVGFAFKEINELVDDLYEFITRYVNREETEESKKAKN